MLPVWYNHHHDVLHVHTILQKCQERRSLCIIGNNNIWCDCYSSYHRRCAQPCEVGIVAVFTDSIWSCHFRGSVLNCINFIVANILSIMLKFSIGHVLVRRVFIGGTVKQGLFLAVYNCAPSLVYNWHNVFILMVVGQMVCLLRVVHVALQ